MRAAPRAPIKKPRGQPIIPAIKKATCRSSKNKRRKETFSANIPKA